MTEKTENGTASVVVVSCTEEDPKNVIESVIGDLPPATLENGIECYPWHLDTKYYEADIRLCAMREKSLASKSFAETVHAVIINFDSDSKNAIEGVNEWLRYLKEYGADIKILLCNRCKDVSETGVGKVQVQEWCVINGFELVEVDPLVDEEWEEEQDFVETTGIRRVNQALEAHVWPNLTIKERKDPTTLSGLWHGGLCKSADADHRALNPDNIEPDPEDLLEGGDFNDLFGQLVSLKEKATSMGSEDRKQFAEQIVLAYWNAIGGDEDDILDC
ncbi:alpha- and gamma-adaptin-binding protein p34-like [Cimex lectularius]|uniref:Alpha-and gamma-adaptin-binding protein p34 n=1 Tax=Cimex lectularius TaxID=79782 RepID=A0A8I6RT68_CIMLE|nr:alpha- and gamma-adaptin-binding protein p34-like [Cimex lectularius]